MITYAERKKCSNKLLREKPRVRLTTVNNDNKGLISNPIVPRTVNIEYTDNNALKPSFVDARVSIS